MLDTVGERRKLTEVDWAQLKVDGDIYPELQAEGIDDVAGRVVGGVARERTSSRRQLSLASDRSSLRDFAAPERQKSLGRSLVLDSKVVATHWPLTGVMTGRPHPDGGRRVIVPIRSDQGEFVAKVDSKPLHTRPLGSGPALAHLAAVGFRGAPAIVRTRSGEVTLRLGKTTVVVLESIPSVVMPSEGLWSELGRLAFELHSDTSYPDWFAVPISAGVQEILDSEVVADRTRLEAVGRRCLELEQMTPVGLVHGEINEANAGLRSNGEVVLLDWDEAGSAPVCIDVGAPLISRFVSEADNTFDDQLAQAFFGGYREGGGELDERSVFTASLFHALRHIRFGDVDRRWRRICFAVEHESELVSVVR